MDHCINTVVSTMYDSDKMRFLYKFYNSGTEQMLAICDAGIIGEKFEEGDIQISVTKEFYGGKECTEKEALDLIKSPTIINAVGKDKISIMVRKKLVEKENVLYIQGVPHAQAVSVA